MSIIYVIVCGKLRLRVESSKYKTVCIHNTRAELKKTQVQELQLNLVIWNF